MIQNGCLLLSGTAEWKDDAPLQCPLCDETLKASESTMHLLLDCAHLAEDRSGALSDISRLMANAPPPAPPKASARVAVPLPAALVQCAKACADAATDTPDEYRVPLALLLLCAQWPALDEDVLNLLGHEAAELTWYATAAVWVLGSSILGDLPARDKRKPGKLDSICTHPSWCLVCTRPAKWCSMVFDELCSALLRQHAEDSERHHDVSCLLESVKGQACICLTVWCDLQPPKQSAERALMYCTLNAKHTRNADPSRVTQARARLTSVPTTSFPVLKSTFKC